MSYLSIFKWSFKKLLVKFLLLLWSMEYWKNSWFDSLFGKYFLDIYASDAFVGNVSQVSSEAHGTLFAIILKRFGKNVKLIYLHNCIYLRGSATIVSQAIDRLGIMPLTCMTLYTSKFSCNNVPLPYFTFRYLPKF